MRKMPHARDDARDKEAARAMLDAARRLQLMPSSAFCAPPTE